MATEAQTLANRANAKKSTGPRSEAGKLRSARNALKHGLRARVLLDFAHSADHELPGPFAALLCDLVAELQPVGVREEFCVETIAVTMWRLRRVVAEELNLLEALHARTWEENSAADLARQPSDPTPRMIPYASLPQAQYLLPLMRYEAHLDRQRLRAQRELLDLRALRLSPGGPCATSSPHGPLPDPDVAAIPEPLLPNEPNSPLPSPSPTEPNPQPSHPSLAQDQPRDPLIRCLSADVPLSNPPAHRLPAGTAPNPLSSAPHPNDPEHHVPPVSPVLSDLILPNEPNSPLSPLSSLPPTITDCHPSKPSLAQEQPRDPLIRCLSGDATCPTHATYPANPIALLLDNLRRPGSLHHLLASGGTTAQLAAWARRDLDRTQASSIPIDAPSISV